MALKSIGVVIGVVILALVIAALIPKPETEQHHEGDGHDHSSQAQQAQPTEKPEITEVRAGKGRVIEPGDMVTVHYEAFLADGNKKVDSSRDKGQPLKFLFGGGLVMPGWDMGLEGAREGAVRKLVVPSKLAYGEKGSEDGKIPPNATLRFEIEVLKVEKITDEPLLDPLLKGTELDKARDDHTGHDHGPGSGHDHGSDHRH